MANRFEESSKKAAAQTNKELSRELTELVHLPEERIDSLFPEEVDKANLKELISIVNNATGENERVNELRDKIETCGKVALRLVKEYINPLT